MPTNSEDRHQLELVLPHVEAVTPELVRIIRRKPTLLSAWNFAQEFSCLKDKQVYDRLEIDSSHWTKIGKGTASPPADERFTKYFDIVQNEFPLIWLAEARGYDWTTIRKHQTEAEQKLAAANRRIAELEQREAIREDLLRKVVIGK